MSNQAFRYDFTGKELFYFLFKKKKCPKCGGRLVAHKDFEMADGSQFVSNRGYYLPKNAKVKHYSYFYDCQRCAAQFMLRELAK